MNEITASIIALNEKLTGTSFDFAFLGGSVLSLLVNDPTVDAIRVTKDVDVVMGVRTRSEFHREERELEALGFKHDTSEDAPICRWLADGVKVDVLPVREEVLGWKSEWFEQALHAAQTVDIEGHVVKVVTAPFFVALKLEAFEDRGREDFITSTDFEDVICLFNGRPGLVEEIISEAVVCNGIRTKFSRYVKNADLEDAVLGFVQTENAPEERFCTIMSAFQRLAGGDGGVQGGFCVLQGGGGGAVGGAARPEGSPHLAARSVIAPYLAGRPTGRRFHRNRPTERPRQARAPRNGQDARCPS